MLPRLGAGQVRSARCAMPQILEAGQVRPIVGSASCNFSSPTHSSMFKFEFSLLASFEYTFYGSLFGFLRVIANLSLVSWRGKQAMRTLARQQAKESSRDSRKLASQKQLLVRDRTTSVHKKSGLKNQIKRWIKRWIKK